MMYLIQHLMSLYLSKLPRSVNAIEEEAIGTYTSSFEGHKRPQPFFYQIHPMPMASRRQKDLRNDDRAHSKQSGEYLLIY